MAKKKDRLQELFDLEIDYSNPVDRFAVKAGKLLNKLGRKMKESGRADGAEYGDGSARIYLSEPVSIELLIEFDREVRILAEDTNEIAKLDMPIVNITVAGYEIDVAFC
ncbi:hypothetical protein LCGC14_1748350 [marine sediment metagenome]|uniref:Uncharacterized protein n=1 Tax=marine sediment metagenome TaxID=412755 RepID=A0A0F9JJU1_9ZZZZ